MALDNDFWRYACSLYGLPKVSSKLLFLQDNYHLDVVALLFIAWLGSNKKNPDKKHLDVYLQLCQYWQENIIAPIRQARRELKQHNGDLYKQAKDLELRTEQALMAKLYQQVKCTGSVEQQGLTTEEAMRYYLQKSKLSVDFSVIEPYLVYLN